MTVRKIPLRTCLGCRQQKPKKELIRVVKNKDGEFCVDRTGKMSGRGAYICEDMSCFKAARKAKRFENAFECEIPQEIFERLEAQLSKDE